MISEFASNTSAERVAMSIAQNPGAFLFQREFLSEADLATLTDLAVAVADQKRSIATSERYGSLKWYEVPLDTEMDISARIIRFLGVKTPNLFAFYYLEPGAVLHPHRDLTGANLNNRIRFHIPIITNPHVDFRVSGMPIRMEPRDLWCLDTSYVHSVRNDGADSRIHVVIECDLTPELRQRLPRGPAAQLHILYFVFALTGKFFGSLFRNGFTNPRYFVDQTRMIARFIGWRFLGIGKPR